MTRNEILQAASELTQCFQGQDESKAKAIAFSLLVEALLCLREIADNTAAPVKVANEHTFVGGTTAAAEACRKAMDRVKSTI